MNKENKKHSQIDINKFLEEENIDDEDDELYDDAKEFVVDSKSKRVSASSLQKALGVDSFRAKKLLIILEDNAIIGPDNGSGSREIFKKNDEEDAEKEFYISEFDELNRKNKNTKKKLNWLIIIIVISFFIYIANNSSNNEIEGVVKYDDCRQIINLKEGDSETHNKTFTCNSIKTQGGKIMGGVCVNIETENGLCNKAYVYNKQQDSSCKNSINDGIFYPYLGYNDSCYTEPQGEQSYVDSLSLPVPNLASSSILPTEIGECSKTTILKIGNRLENVNDSGTAIEYANGGSQVSYETILSSKGSVVGDEVYLCLISVPENCPAGDNRGKIYSSVNLRNGKYWQGQDSQHSCGGV